MLTLHKQLPSAATEQERKRIQRQITSTDEEIDQLVHALYGLTAEEIATVEGAQQGFLWRVRWQSAVATPLWLGHRARISQSGVVAAAVQIRNGTRTAP